MIIQLTDPAIKRISFLDYEKYFMEALKSPDPPFHILFYKKEADGLSISFSWDNFIIITKVLYSEILEIYKNQNLATADVILSDKEDHPVLLKFYSDYLFNRGIMERD
jgi:hypothetical protein